jgi:hypothetical protein
VVLPDGRDSVTCETLDDACRLAVVYAVRILPCELVVRDAYHRVIDHEMINRRSATAGLGSARYAVIGVYPQRDCTVTPMPPGCRVLRLQRQ